MNAPAQQSGGRGIAAKAKASKLCEICCKRAYTGIILVSRLGNGPSVYRMFCGSDDCKRTAERMRAGLETRRSTTSAPKPARPALEPLKPLPKPGTAEYKRAASDYVEQTPYDLRPKSVWLSDQVRAQLDNLLEFDKVREKACWLLGSTDGFRFDLTFAEPVQTGDWRGMKLARRKDAIERAELMRCRLVGVAHAHPSGPALPSPADIELRLNARELGSFVSVIVAPRDISRSRGYDSAYISPITNAFVVASGTGLVTKVEPRHIPEWLAA